MSDDSSLTWLDFFLATGKFGLWLFCVSVMFLLIGKVLDVFVSYLFPKAGK